MKNKVKMLFNSLIGRLFISYIIIIIIVCISNYLSHSFIYDVLEERLIKENKSEFDNIVKDCEKYITDVKNYLLYIDMDTNFQKIISSKSISDYLVFKLSYYMQNKYIESPKYVNSWIYHENTDYIITKLASYPKEMFWGRLYNSPMYDSKFWESQVNINTQFVIYPPAFYYDNSLPFSGQSNNIKKNNKYLTIIYKSFSNINYYLCAFVDINKFLESNNSIFSDKVNIIIGNDNPDGLVSNKINGTYILGYFSEQNNIYYYMDLDYSNIKQDLNSINIKFTMIIILAIILCLLFSLIFSIKINMPIKSIGQIFLNKETDKNYTTSFIDLETIKKRIYSLMQMNMQYKNEIENRDMQIEGYAFLDKIRNLYIPKEIVSNINFDLTNGFYVICIRTHLVNLVDINFKKRAKVFYEYKEKLNEFFFNQNKHELDCIYFSQNQDSFILLLSAINQNLNSSIDLIKEYLEKIKHTKVSFTILVSEIQKDLNNLDSIYNKFLNLQEKRSIGNKVQVIYQNNIIREKEHYIFNVHEMKNFSDFIKNGYIDQGIEVMKCILKNNYKRNISCFQFTILCYEFINLSIKTVIDAYSYLPEEIDVIEVYSILKALVCYEDYLYTCEEFIRSLSNYLRSTTNTNDYIVDYIIKHIEEKYYEDIYLDLFAQKLNVSSVYICKHFKEKMGINLLDYLNKYRMEIACDKLKNTDLKIKDIAYEVGITNVNSFIRIFKKYYGQTPGDYRTFSIAIK